MRHLIDARGREWHIHERTTGEYSPVAGRPSLIFDSEGIVRRVWRYPTNWANLPDAELLQLMESIRAKETVG